MCRDLCSRTMQLVLFLLLSLTQSSHFTCAQNVEETTATRSNPFAGLRAAENRKLEGETPNSLLIRINQDTFPTISGRSGGSSLFGSTYTAPLENLGSWIVSLDGIDVGIATQNNGLFLSPDENTSFRLVGGTQVCIRPQYDIDVQISQILDQVQTIFGGSMWAGNGSTRGIQDYCYALREEDFFNRNGVMNEAWVTFTLTPEGQADVITSSALSDSPSAMPSRQPSGEPSAKPSSAPSYFPNDSPSEMPSRQPSGIPSASPSDSPTNLPSSVPTPLPSGIPSIYPEGQKQSITNARNADDQDNASTDVKDKKKNKRNNVKKKNSKNSSRKDKQD
jgi:hypothetical protein